MTSIVRVSISFCLFFGYFELTHCGNFITIYNYDERMGVDSHHYPTMQPFTDHEITATSTFRSCGNGAMHIKSMYTTPNPPLPNKEVVVSFIGTTEVDIQEGARYEWTNSTPKKDLIFTEHIAAVCDEGANECPMKRGKIHMRTTLMGWKGHPR